MAGSISLAHTIESPWSLEDWKQALIANEWSPPDPSAHPLVAETWAAASSVYDAGVVVTPVITLQALAADGALNTSDSSSGWRRADISGSTSGECVAATRAASGGAPAEGEQQRQHQGRGGLQQQQQPLLLPLHLKLESRQATGSFKARGAAHKIFSMDEEQLCRGTVTCSTGNHALGFLHAFRQRMASPPAGLEAVAIGSGMSDGGAERVKIGGSDGVTGPPPLPTIYLPNTTSAAKADKLRALGARLVFHGSDCAVSEAEARRVAGEEGMVYVSPYNDQQVAGGQGTVALELLAQLPREQLDVLFVPVGGGGLMAGIASFVKASDPSVHVVGCQPALSDVMAKSVAAGRVVQVESGETLSDGTAGGIDEGSLTLEPCIRFVDEWAVASEEEIAAALLELREDHGVECEGSAAMTYACAKKVLRQKREGAAAATAAPGAGAAAPEMDRQGGVGGGGGAGAVTAACGWRGAAVIICGGNVSADAYDAARAIVGQRQDSDRQSTKLK